MIKHEINRLKPIKAAQVNSDKEKCTKIKSSSDKRICFNRSSINSLLFLFVFLNLFLVGNSWSQKNPRDLSSTRQNRVLLIALGGFRHDLVESYNLKNFAQFVEESSRASHLNPQFTTQSFPNLWSIATGAYVESHGIVANRFYDPLYNEYFHENGRNSKKWWNSTLPLWTYTVRKGLKTGVYHWPGSEIDFERQEQSYYQEPIENRRESLYKSIPHNENTPLETKLNRSVKWLSEEGYKLVCVYHNQPDAIAKKYGPNSPEFNVSLTQLDHSFGALIDSLKSSGLYNANDFNLVVVSDHGFTSIRKHVFVNEYLNESDARIWSFSATLIHLKPLISLDALLQKVAKMPGITVTMRNRMPDRLHYKSSRRIGEIIISALEGVVFIYMTRAPIDVNGRSVQLTYDQEKMLLLAASDKAAHGYDPIYPSMKGVFWAHGAAFKDAYNPGTPVDNVDVYPIICRVLDVECETRNGSLDNVVHFLKPHYQTRFLDSGNLDYVANRAAVFSSRVKIDRLFLLMLYFYLVF